MLGYTCAEMHQLSDTFRRLSQKTDKKPATRASAASQSAYWAEQAQMCDTPAPLPPAVVVPPLPNVSVLAYNAYGQPVTLSVAVDAQGNPILPTGYTLTPPGAQPGTPPISTDPIQPPLFTPNTQQTMTLINTYGQAVTLTVTIDQSGHALLPQGYNFIGGQATPYGMMPEPQYVPIPTQGGVVITPIDETGGVDENGEPLTMSATAKAPKGKRGAGGLGLNSLLLIGVAGALIWLIMKKQKGR